MVLHDHEFLDMVPWFMLCYVIPSLISDALMSFAWMDVVVVAQQATVGRAGIMIFATGRVKRDFYMKHLIKNHRTRGVLHID